MCVIVKFAYVPWSGPPRVDARDDVAITHPLRYIYFNFYDEIYICESIIPTPIGGLLTLTKIMIMAVSSTFRRSKIHVFRPTGTSKSCIFGPTIAK